MKKFIFPILLILSITAQAQNISGKVCLEKDRSPVPFATVGLLQLPDSAIITGVISLTDGGYLFEKVKPGNYYLQVRFVGYQTNGKNVTVEAGHGEIAVDTIYLVETTTSLGEVTVVGERIKGKEMVDRTVYAIPSVIAKTSITGYDLLKKIPQVNVDFQNNITLNGSSNFIIQVDGRQRDREYLAKLLPSDIESIEIISNPSGKYEGNIDGVINIILKKEARYGISGNAALQIKPINKLTEAGSGSLDYSAGKITFYITGFTFIQNLHISSWNESHFITNDSTTSQLGNGTIKITNSSLNGGFDYYMSDKNNLSFNISYKPIGQDINILGESLLSKGNNPMGTISSITNENLHSDESSASLFYKKSFDKAIQEFTVETNYYWFNSNSTNKFANTRYPYESDSIISTYSRLEVNINQRNYFSTKLNYVQPLGMNAKIETGYQLYYQWLSYDFNIDNQENSNLFKYAEFRNSIYGGITYNLKKIGFQAVVRVENSQIKADSVTDHNYTCVLPSVNLQYKFSASHNLKFTYNRRINRPGIYDMNPYYKVDQNYNVTQGNPNLKPDYRDRLQLTYTWNFGSNYFSPYVYHEFFTDKIGMEYQVITNPVNNTLTTFTKPYNLLSGHETGGGVNAMLWYVNISARVYAGHYDQYTGQSFVIPAVDYFSWSITSYAFANFTKSKKTTAFAFLQYNGVNQNAQSKTYSLPFYGFGAQQQLKNHSFGVFWLLPFSANVKLSKTETATPYYTSTNTIGFNVANYIQFSYSYKFNKGKNIKKLDRKVEVESDSKSQAIGK
ncbi:MAG: outer membrane beta-barrel family protein [Bacteroidales bacterium]|jgi:outer membrane receptor protein involved in Fe transport